MSLHTYIGARYVPRFLGTYDPTQQYDALDVVDNGSGTSYIARKTVPAGTPLTDTDYWFVYGASSGAIIQLQNDMIQAQNDIISLNEEIDLLKYGDIILMSDSYGYSPSIPDAWTGKLEALLPNNCYIFNGGGHGFGSTPSLVNDLISHETDVTDPDKVGAIIVACGYNDRTVTANIAAGIASFATYVASQYKNATVYIAFIGLSTNGSYTYTLRNNVAFLYKREAAKHPNTCFICDSDRFFINYANMQIDGIHPAPAGGSDIAHGIKNYLTSKTIGYCGNDFQITQTLKSSGGHDTPYADKTVTCTLANDQLSILLGGNLLLNYSTAQTPLQYYEIGTLDDAGFLNGTKKEYCGSVYPCQIYTDEATPRWITGAGWIGIENGKFYYKVASTINYTRISIPGGNIKVPLIYC